MSNRIRNHSTRARGFSLVEIMVAALIGMIGSIVIFQVFAVFEAQKRTTSGAGDAQQNGLLALFSIEREARMAGYGVTYEPLLGCTVNGFDAIPPGRNFSFRLTAAEITDGAGGAPDTITFVYGSSSLVQVPVKLISPSGATSTTFLVDNRFGFQPGDLLVAGEVGKTCGFAQATSLPAAVGQTLEIGHTTGNYVNAGGTTVSARYNQSGGMGVAYAAWDNTAQSGGRLYNLGPTPSIVTYAVTGSQLTNRNLITSAVFNPVVDGIVQLQAQYGHDTDGDGDIDSWTSTMPATPTATDWSRVIALRLAVVARSSTPERPNPATGVCDITTATLTWAGGALDLTATTDWQCYRYRVFETVVPLRNLIWKPA